MIVAIEEKSVQSLEIVGEFGEIWLDFVTQKVSLDDELECDIFWSALATDRLRSWNFVDQFGGCKLIILNTWLIFQVNACISHKFIADSKLPNCTRWPFKMPFLSLSFFASRNYYT